MENGASWLEIFFAPRGRINRLQFWIVTFVTLFVGNVNAYVINSFDKKPAKMGWLVLVVGVLVALACFYAGLNGALKRLHDRDKSGSWYLLGIIPIIGWIWLLVELGFRPGIPGPNRFGLDPS